MNTDTILVISNQIAYQNSIVNWPDLNYPGTGQTILRTVHHVDYDALTLKLDQESGPAYNVGTLPPGVAFYKKICK